MSHEQLDSPNLIDLTAPVGLVITDANGQIIAANPYLIAMLGLGASETLIGSQIQDILAPAAKLYFGAYLQQLIHLNGGFTEVALKVAWDKTGSQDVLISAACHPDGVTYAIYPALARKDRERELSAMRELTETKNKLLMQIENIALVGAWTLDLATMDMIWSDAVYKIYEIPVGNRVDLDTVLSCYPETTRSEAMGKIDQTIKLGEAFDFKSEFITVSGKKRWVRSVAEVEYLAGKPVRLLGVSQDVTDQHLAQEKLWQLAHYDPLTGLANRTLFQSVFNDELQKAAENQTDVFLIMIDLDGFKVVNDALGHGAGDIVLKAIGRRVSAIQGSRLCGRLGGDEFVVILSETTQSDALEFANEVLRVGRKPITAVDHECAVSVSIGIASFPTNGQATKTLLKRADLALYEAKKSGKGLAVQFHDRLETEFDAKQADLNIVQQAVTGGTLKPYYQPKLDLASGTLIGFEALARIEASDGTILTPGAFASAFTDQGGSLLIHNAILDHLLRDLRNWLDRGLNPGIISFNLSEAALRQPDFPSNFLYQVEQAGIPNTSIMIEITETAFLGHDTDKVKAALAQLQDNGCKIALDDFGTGFASLSHLRDFPIDKIKIDKSFILGLGSHDGNDAIVSAIVSLAHRLDMKVIAEGIETEAQLSYLLENRCDAGQGYFFSEAVPAFDVISLIQKLARSDEKFCRNIYKRDQ
ncbi:putative bifunctional diguanylate cyclase/phosphodiesterase [Ochrobactrum sp. EDr1-4]|uniref:putative bifunctional diguanylate cyclase/phosphodiesterase n=1 Tax=Ochrobactrum sp. EDr1-4 TaxID=3368622 RepID=UPI003BA16983